MNLEIDRKDNSHPLPHCKSSLRLAVCVYVKNLTVFEVENLSALLFNLGVSSRVYIFVSEIYMDVQFNLPVDWTLVKIDFRFLAGDNLRKLWRRIPEPFVISVQSEQRLMPPNFGLPLDKINKFKSGNLDVLAELSTELLRKGLEQDFPFRSEECEKIPASIYTENKIKIVRSFYGTDFIKFRASSNLIRNLRSQILKKEPDTIDWIYNVIRPNEIVFDIGSNIGTYALIIGSLYLNSTKVFAFEPMKANFDELQFNISLNGLNRSIEPLRVAMSDKVGVAQLQLSSTEPGSALHSIGRTSGASEAGREQMTFEEVPTYSIDEFCKERGIVPHHLKIDVDGIEAEIIEGGSATLSNPTVRSLLIELDFSSERDLSCLKKIESLGFEIYHVEKKPAVGIYAHSQLANIIFLKGRIFNRPT